jgi:malate dehydrogenase
MRSVCEDIKELAPDAVVVNLVEPVDLLTSLAQQVLGFDRHRVVGIGGLLTSTRLRYLVSNTLGVSPREVTAVVIGPHDTNMVFLRDTIRVSGIPMSELVAEEQIDGLIEQAREAGDSILMLAQRSTSYYGPSAAAATLVDAIVRDTRATLPVSVVCEGEYGVEHLGIGVLGRIGSPGVREILDVPMSESEASAFRSAASELKAAWEHVNREESGA